MAIQKIRGESYPVDDRGPEFHIISTATSTPSEAVAEGLASGLRAVDEEAFDPALWLPAGKIRDAIMSSDRIIWVASPRDSIEETATDPSNVIGYMMLQFGPDARTDAHRLGVRQEWRRRQVGTRLADAAFKYVFLETNTDQVHMTMRTDNHAIRTLSERAVEKLQYLGSDFPDGQPRDELVLTRDKWHEVTQARESLLNLDQSSKHE